MSQKTKRFNKKDSPMMSLLEDLGIDFSRRDHTYYKLKANGFMDLIVETWSDPDIKNTMKISVCHYGEQNGDAMRDPEVVFMLGFDSSIEIPEYYRNDYTGTEQEVYPVIDGKQMINPSLLQDLKRFSRQWADNIHDQGFQLVVSE